MLLQILARNKKEIRKKKKKEEKRIQKHTSTIEINNKLSNAVQLQ